jgi:hypothetical protein
MNSDKINYILDTFKSVYNIPNADSLIHYLEEPQNKPGITILKSKLSEDFYNNHSPLNLEDIRTISWGGIQIPLLFSEKHKSNFELYTISQNSVIINVDILAASFYLLSGWQEYYSDRLDPYGRFPYSESVQKTLKISRIPLVNYYFDILKIAIEKFLNKEIKYNDNSNGAFNTFLTHDIDILKTIWMEDAFSSLKKGSIYRLFKSLSTFFKPIIKSSYIKTIIDIEKSFKAKSTFFFLPVKGFANGIKCADYSINKNLRDKVILYLKQNGWGVSVHASPGSETDSIQLAKDITTLGTNPIGNRSHFLLFNSTKTPLILSNSGLKYDSSLGFAEEIGFRNSFCHPFFIYDLENDKVTDILEVPLNVMDTTLQRKEYLGGSVNKLELIKSIISEVQKFKGTFTLLWHNNYFSDIKHVGYRDLYISLLDYLSDNNTEFITEELIINRYRKEGTKKTF